MDVASRINVSDETGPVLNAGPIAAFEFEAYGGHNGESLGERRHAGGAELGLAGCGVGILV